MNEHIDESKRSGGELTLFGIAFVGLVVAVAGIVINSGRVALFGVGLIAVSLLGFLLRQE